MPEKEEPSATIPWLPLITLIGVGSGVLIFFPQLTSSRPGGGDTLLTSSTFDEQSINARLWQDPLGVASADAKKNEKQRDDKNHNYSQLHSVARFQELLIHKCFAESAAFTLIPAIQPLEEKSRFGKQAAQLQILAVVIPGGPYVEDVERRLRARRAVIEGLGIAHYDPERAEQIGYFYVPWQPLAPTAADSVPVLERNRREDEEPRLLLQSPIEPVRHNWHDPDGPSLLIPCEWFEQASFSTEKRPVEHLLVLWLTDNALLDAPLARLSDLISWFRLKHVRAFQAADFLPLPHITVLGPDNSGTLRQLVLEAQNDSWSDDTLRLLVTTHIYSSQAAASESQLLSGIKTTQDRPIPFRRDCKDLIERNVKRLQLDSGFCFDRTIFADDQIVDTLRQELDRRGVKENDNVAIVSEEDTFYSRALCSTFDPAFSLNVHSYTYLRGIDGKLPYDGKDEKAGKAPSDNTDKSTQPSSQPRAPAEQTEGRNQADDIRRLATMLQSLDTKLRNKNSGNKPAGGLKAIGLLGSDVYDKLELLKALRPVFPQVLFFTNNLDARLAHPDEWNETHNLLVVSARGLSLIDPDQTIQKVAPFRDSGQTALFESTLLALGKIHIGDDRIPKSPLIFEIARDGPNMLNPAADESEFRKEFFKSLIRYVLSIAAFVALGIMLLAWIRLVSRVTLTSSTGNIRKPEENAVDFKTRGTCVEAN